MRLPTILFSACPYGSLPAIAGRKFVCPLLVSSADLPPAVDHGDAAVRRVGFSALNAPGRILVFCPRPAVRDAVRMAGHEIPQQGWGGSRRRWGRREECVS